MRFLFGLLAVLITSPAFADMGPAEFFARDLSNNWKAPLTAAPSPYGRPPRSVAVPASREHVAALVTKRSQERLGTRWTAVALRLTKVESGFRCNATGPATRHGRAKGPLQLLDGSARMLGYDPARLHECDYGVQAGIAHMALCLRSGVQTDAQMAACHVAGPKGWQRRLARKPEKYKQSYIRLAMR